MKNFRTYDLSKNLYQMIEQIECPPHLSDQVLRSASSVVLNIAEGAGLPSKKQKAKHYGIAMGSLRETQAALDLNRLADISKIRELSDQVAAHLYKLCQSTTI